MIIIRVVITLLLLINLTACASLGFGNSKTEFDRLEKRANDFYHYIKVRDVENIYNLLTPWVKAENPKDEYIGNVEAFLSHVHEYRYDYPTVVLLKDKIAITQANYNLVLDSFEVSNCERTVWLRFPGGWYIQEPSLRCDYMPDEERIKFLTKNLPE